MVLGVAGAQALQDCQSLLGVRRLDGDRLETPLQGRVLLDVLAVLIKGRGADALDLSARQRRFEHVGGVDRALGSAGPDERVQFVDEEDHVLGSPDLVHDGLDAFLELAAILGSRDHHRQVEDHHATVVEQVGNVLGDDLLRETFDDGGLAHTGLAEEHRVVLGPAAQHLHEPLDFVLAADDRIEFVGPSELRQVAPEAVECGRLALAAARGGARFAGRLQRFGGLIALNTRAEQAENLLTDLLELEAEIHEHLCRHAVVFAQQAEQEVLGADVVVVEVARFLDRVLDHLLGTRCLRKLAHGHHVGTALDELLHLEADLAKIDVEVLENVGADTGAFLDQAEKNVLGADVFVVESLGLLVGQGHDFASPICEAFEHVKAPGALRPLRPAGGSRHDTLGPPKRAFPARTCPEPKAATPIPFYSAS